MADPEGYEPQFDFSDFQSTDPKRPLPGHELDVELWNISNAIGGTQSALSDIRRSDGRLKNGIVDADAIGPTAVGALIGQSTELMEDVNFVAGMYLGQLANDPTTGRDGAALEPSNWYYNTATQGYRYYTPDGWRPMTGVATIRQYRYITTAGQTVISGLDADGFQYFASGQSVAVYKNGAALAKGVGYTTPNNTSIVLTSPASNGDTILVLAFEEALPTQFGRIVRRLHVADGTATSFAMPTGATNIGQVLAVAIDGVAQDFDKYTVAGSNVVLTAAPRSGERVQITAWTAVPVEDSNTRRAYAFATRAAMIAALGWPWEVGSVVSDGAVQYEYVGTGTDIPDMPGWVPYGDADLRHWGGGAGVAVATNNAAMVNAMAWLNVGGRSLHLPDGNVSFSAPWPEITGSNVEIIGEGTQVVIAATAASARLVTIGSDTTLATNVSIKVTAFTTNVTFPDDHMFWFKNTTRAQVDTRLNNCCSVARFGTATTPAKQCEFKANGAFSRGANAMSVFLVEHATELTLSGSLNCGVASNVTANGAMVRIKPPAGAIVDTVCMRGLMMQSYSDFTNGKPYGLVIDLTDEKVTNVWGDESSLFDHTTVAAVYIVDNSVGPASRDARSYKFHGMRFSSDIGSAVILEKNNALSVWSDWNFSGNFFGIRSTSPIVRVIGTGTDLMHAIRFENNALLTSGSNICPVAVEIGAPMTFRNNIISTNDRSAAGITTAIEVTNAALTRLTIAGNVVPEDVTNNVVVPTWATANAPRRHVSWPGMTTQRTLAFDQHGTVLGVGAVTAGNISVGELSVVVMNMTSPQTITDITKTFAGAMQVTFINAGTNAVTFNHGAGKLRNISGAAVVLNQYQSVTYLWQAGAAWQQIGGKT